MTTAEDIALIETTVPIIEKMGLKVVELRRNYAKLKLPIDQNTNHIGVIYAGSLFSLGEVAGGALFLAAFDKTVFLPIVKQVDIRFRRMAMTDVTVEVAMTQADVERISAIAEKEGKADFELALEIKDRSGEVCCIVNGTWQIRKG